MSSNLQTIEIQTMRRVLLALTVHSVSSLRIAYSQTNAYLSSRSLIRMYVELFHGVILIPAVICHLPLQQVVHHHYSNYVPAHAAPKPSVRLWTIVAGVLEPRDGIH